MKKIVLLLILIISALSLYSCKTTEATCIKPQTKDQIIRWGEYNAKSGLVTGYQINTDFMIYRIKMEPPNKDYTLQEIGKIQPLTYCDMVEMIKDEVLKTQALNAPGEQNKFIEYTNPGTKVSSRNVWNVKFNTLGSKGFREIYDSLQTLVSFDIQPIKK
jgi:hypothetical protein